MDSKGCNPIRIDDLHDKYFTNARKQSKKSKFLTIFRVKFQDFNNGGKSLEFHSQSPQNSGKQISSGSHMFQKGV